MMLVSAFVSSSPTRARFAPPATLPVVELGAVLAAAVMARRTGTLAPNATSSSWCAASSVSECDCRMTSSGSSSRMLVSSRVLRRWGDVGDSKLKPEAGD